VAARGPWSAVAAVALAAGVLGWSGARPGPTARALRGLLLVLALLAAWHLWQSGPARAIEVVGDLLALVLLATAFTTCTPVDEVLDALTRALRPLRRVGVDPDRVALVFSLMLRAIPDTIALAEETRDAARARGLERDPRARLTPLVLRVVARAHDTGDALHARGVGDED
jgi:biotin transport system permease protein